jgi:hypothetical protein
MKKFFASEMFLSIMFSMVLGLIIGYALVRETDPERWYVGKHDSQCEKLEDKNTCDCYNRFLAADKAKYSK